MYRLWYGSELLYDPRRDDLPVTDITADLSLYECAVLQFTMHRTHPMWKKVEPMVRTSEVVLERDGHEVFRGRVLKAEEDFYGAMSYYVAGSRSYLNDVILPVYETGVGDCPSEVDGLFGWYIAQYNNNVHSTDKLSIGINEGALLDPNNYVLRASEQRPHVWDEVKEKIVDSLGGFVRMRYENGQRVIDLLADGGKESAQRIEFGENLLDYMRTTDGTDFATKLIPLGQAPEKEEGATEDPVVPSLLDMPDQALPDGFWKVGEGIVNVKAAEKYGIIETTVQTEAATLDGLLQSGLRHAKAISIGDTIELTSADLSILAPDIDYIMEGDYVRVTSRPHGVDAWFLCTARTVTPESPDQETYTLGSEYATLTTVQANRLAALNADVNSVYEQTAAMSDDVKAAAIEADNAASLASQKRRVFYTQPVPPYEPGDLWVQGSTGDIFVCVKGRNE